MAIELVLWGRPAGSTDAIDDKVLYTQGKTLADIERVQSLAAADGWHSFRIQELDLAIAPDFAQTVGR